LGAAFHLFQHDTERFVALAVGLGAGISGVLGLLVGSSILVWETRRTLEVISTQAKHLRDQRATREKQTPSS
jgi:hypothetical protein